MQFLMYFYLTILSYFMCSHLSVPYRSIFSQLLSNTHVIIHNSCRPISKLYLIFPKYHIHIAKYLLSYIHVQSYKHFFFRISYDNSAVQHYLYHKYYIISYHAVSTIIFIVHPNINCKYRVSTCIHNNKSADVYKFLKPIQGVTTSSTCRMLV